MTRRTVKNPEGSWILVRLWYIPHTRRPDRTPVDRIAELKGMTAICDAALGNSSRVEV